MIIEFGDWRLVPTDSLNWELCHRHEVTRGKNAGTVKWNRLGRYYSHGTFGNALLYAADCELKSGRAGEALGIVDALAEYRAIAMSIEAAARRMEASHAA